MPSNTFSCPCNTKFSVIYWIHKYLLQSVQHQVFCDLLNIQTPSSTPATSRFLWATEYTNTFSYPCNIKFSVIYWIHIHTPSPTTGTSSSLWFTEYTNTFSYLCNIKFSVIYWIHKHLLLPLLHQVFCDLLNTHSHTFSCLLSLWPTEYVITFTHSIISPPPPTSFYVICAFLTFSSHSFY